MPIPKDLTTNLLLAEEELPEGWEGCDHLDCLSTCWPSEYHCERLAMLMRLGSEARVEAIRCGRT